MSDDNRTFLEPNGTEKISGDAQFFLSGTVTPESILEVLMEKINHYTLIHGVDKNTRIIISLEEVTFIQAPSAPILLSFIYLLRHFYYWVELLLPLKENVRQFLDVSGFYEASLYTDSYGTKRDLFQYDKLLSVSYDVGKHYNPDNRIVRISGVKDYYTLSSDEQKKIKELRQDQYKGFISAQHFQKIIEKIYGKDTRDREDCINAISELICNSELYSLSDSFVNFQMKSKNEYNMCVCDTGIGFEMSLINKKINPNEVKRYLTKENIKIFSKIDKKYHNEFFAIFTALKGSEETERDNLWSLIKLISTERQKLIIHSGRIQITFDNSLDYTDVKTCMNSTISTFNKRKSNISLCSARMVGVHIMIFFWR